MKGRQLILVLLLVFLFSSPAASRVINENTDQLPSGCDSVSGRENITVQAGSEYAEQFNGKAFTFDKRDLQFEPCTRVTVTFVNNDSVRHQWMVHGLPMNIYKMGMFTIEVTGPGKDTGTFILPSSKETLLVHCGVPQHMQKGMKAQIKIGGGDGDLANIPGVTGSRETYDYPDKSIGVRTALISVLGLLLGIGAIYYFRIRTTEAKNEE